MAVDLGLFTGRLLALELGRAGLPEEANRGFLGGGLLVWPADRAGLPEDARRGFLRGLGLTEESERV